MPKITHESIKVKQADADLDEQFSRIHELINKQSADMRIRLAIKLGKKIKIIHENVIQALAQDAGPLGNVCRKAVDVFESEENAAVWLFSPINALDGQIPISLLDTEEGIKLVTDTLGRIQWGIYS